MNTNENMKPESEIAARICQEWAAMQERARKAREVSFALNLRQIKCSGDVVGKMMLTGCYGGAFVQRYMIERIENGDSFYVAVHESSEPIPGDPGFSRRVLRRLDTGARVVS